MIAMGRTLRGRWIAPTAILIAVGASCATQPPKLTGVLPDTGYPRQLLAVEGTTEFASVVWDVGLTSERQIYTGLFGTQYFQIPDNATPGLHPVALRNSLGTSATGHVMVRAKRGTFPAPRIEDFGILFLSGNGPVDVVLTTAAANLDLNATVAAAQVVGSRSMARAVRNTVSWGALPVADLLHHRPETFGYPVYHYAQLLSVIKGVALGSTLRITVTNNDKQSSTRELQMPASIAMLDGDGDGLLDAWEDGNYTAPSGNTVPLSGIGTNKWRKDILVEVDWMAAAVPQASLWQKIEQVFKKAPVLNPDGSRGVNIIIDHGQGGTLSQGGQTLANSDCLTLGFTPTGTVSGCGSIVDFFTHKAANFSSDRLKIFHYAIFGKKGLDKTLALVSGLGERFGNDFFVTLGTYPASEQQDPDVQLGHFLHELGHNLGFTHWDLMSDDQAIELKLNLPSVMNYVYTDGGVDVDCDTIPDGIYTYSQGTQAALVESHIDETIGICDLVPLDMGVPPGSPIRGDGQYTVGPMDITGNGDTLERSDDFDQWGHMLLDFVNGPQSRWLGN